MMSVFVFRNPHCGFGMVQRIVAQPFCEQRLEMSISALLQYVGMGPFLSTLLATVNAQANHRRPANAGPRSEFQHRQKRHGSWLGCQCVASRCIQTVTPGHGTELVQHFVEPFALFEVWPVDLMGNDTSSFGSCLCQDSLFWYFCVLLQCTAARHISGFHA